MIKRFEDGVTTKNTSHTCLSVFRRLTLLVRTGGLLSQDLNYPTSSSNRSISANHVAALESLGARQSPRGESEPPEPTLGPFGMAERLNWLIWKKR